MEEKRIYPYIIAGDEMAHYYESLLNDEFKVKIFDKKKNKDIYEYFLPLIRSYMFWTFNLRNEKLVEFNDMKNEMKSAVCLQYQCNIFEKKGTQIICFENGISFLITDKDKEAKELIDEYSNEKLEAINIKKGKFFKLDGEDIAHLYVYILQLYKAIYLEMVSENIQKPDLFDVVRNDFVEFTQKVYDVKVTEEDEICEKYEKQLQIEKKYIIVENKFDLMYKNNKLNDNHKAINICLVLLVVFIIIEIINLKSFMG